MNGHENTGYEDDSGADRGQRAQHPAVELRACEHALREDGDEADAGDRQRKPEAERDDQQQSERDAMQRDGREQDDEGGWAREEPAGDADGEQRSEAWRVFLVMVVMMMVVAVTVRPRVTPTRAENRDADRDDEQARGEVQPRIQVVRHDELRKRERHEPECEDAD